MKKKTLSFCLLAFLKVRMLNSTPKANFKMTGPERGDETIKIARWLMWDGCRSLFSLLGMISAAVPSLVNGEINFPLTWEVRTGRDRTDGLWTV